MNLREEHDSLKRMLAKAHERGRREAIEECAKVAEADYTPAYGPHRADMESLAERQRRNIACRIRSLLHADGGEKP